jgi:ABC-2 type transport system permease protein
MSARVWALLRVDLRAAMRDNEQLLLTIGIPAALLVFFSTVDVLPTGTDEPVQFLAPSVLALAVLSMAFVRLAIGLGFDRGFGAIRRFAATPLRVSEFWLAKLAATIVLTIGQTLVLGGIALALGWSPSIHGSFPAALALGLITFVALAFVIAGLTDGLKALAIANGLYIVLLLVSGIVFELTELPGWMQSLVKWLPSTALAELFRTGLDGMAGPSWAWLTLTLWAVVSPVAAIRFFRYS